MLDQLQRQLCFYRIKPEAILQGDIFLEQFLNIRRQRTDFFCFTYLLHRH